MKNNKLVLLVASAAVLFGTVYGTSFLGTFFAVDGSLLKEILSLGNLLLVATLFLPVAAYIALSKNRPVNRRFEVVVFMLLLLIGLHPICYLISGSFDFAFNNPAMVRFFSLNLLTSLMLVPFVHFTVYSKNSNK